MSDNNINKGRRINFQKNAKENQLNLPIPDDVCGQTYLKSVSSLQRAILYSDLKQEKIFEEISKNRLKRNESRKQFDIAFKNEESQSSCEPNELTLIVSGKLAIKSSKQTAIIIEEKSVTDPYLYMSIKKTSSEHVSVDFDTKKESENKNCHEVAARNTPPGTKLLDVNKNMIRILKDTLPNIIPNDGLFNDYKLPSSSGLQIKINSVNDESKNDEKITQLQDLNINKNNEKRLICTNFKASFTEPIVTEIYIPENHYKGRELRANVQRGSLSTCKLVNGEDLQKNVKGQLHRYGYGVKGLFEVNLWVMRNQLLELPAILRPTTSNNYVVVLDKEFENCYNQTVKEYFGDRFEGSVDLQITSSGNYLLELYNNESHLDEKKNAWLVKTSSGNIKIIVRPEFRSIFQRELSINSISSGQTLTQVNSNLPTSSKAFFEDILKESKNLDNQASTGKLKVKLQDDAPLQCSQSSTILKKDTSDQHAVLNKEAKKSFHKLQSDSLTSNLEKPLPMQLDSGEIVIKLNSNDDTRTHYGTLKITPSGNFYVAVDDEVIKDLTESSAKNAGLNSSVGTRSKHAMQLINSVHESVATTCQSKLPVCNDCPYACGCAEMMFESIDGSMQDLCSCLMNASGSNEYEKKVDSDPIPSTSWDETVQTDIEHSFESLESSNKNVFKSPDQCYLLHQLCNDKFCNEHVRKPKLEPKEIIEPKQIIEPKEKIEPTEVIEFVASGEQPSQVWDSLKYLPQQLPYFLREICYRK